MIRGSKSHAILAWLVSFNTICTICLILRFWSAMIQKRKLYVDDVLVLIAYASMLVMLGTGVWGLVNGLGNPTLELTMDELVVQAKLFIASAVAWVLATSVVKVAVLWLYTRIFSMAWFVRLARILMVICACYFITFLVVFITHCDPVDQQWNPVPNGSCRDVTHTELASNTINSIIDLTIVCMPLPCLWSLKMPLRKKITVLFMFSLGFITIGIMFYRIYVTVHSNPDGMIALADVGVLSGMEVWLGFIVACVPTAAPFFKTYVSPALSKASESLFGSYGSSKPSSQSHHVNTIGGSGPAGGSGRNKSGKGRWLGSSYTEISLDYTTYGERPSQDIPLVARPGAAAMSTLRTKIGSGIGHEPGMPGQDGIYVKQEFQTNTVTV